ncbi:MAG TPA: RimK family alpha-L-glutamate ligase [Geminicoccaceae bacterium]|nr:RimK family alpha-L-glutamate ligase [Geminicoccus sp.]HMU49527.1 RimK family alpha-L-glutamate ligase [Geminicoccaceae bacterium]
MAPDILVVGSAGWHWAKLKAAFDGLGVDAGRLAFPALGLELSDGVRLGPLDRLPALALVRFVPAGTLQQITFRLAVLHGLEAAGTVVVNTTAAIERCVDKSATSLRLALAGIPTPATWVTERAEEAARILAEQTAGGGAVVLKPLFGAQGKGLRLLRAGDALPAAAEVDGVWYLQRYVGGETDWRDFRVMVVGGEPVAAMARHGVGWITNIHQGGRPAPVPAAGELARLAVEAALAVGCDHAGVDLIEGRDGRLMVLEVNSMPAWRGLQSVTEVDIAGLLARHVARRLAARLRR